MASFETITTDRLTIRAMTPGDAESLWRRRNDPEAARYQNWTLPFSRARADELVASVADQDGPTNDEWWMAAVCERGSGDVVGDLAVHLTFDERCAEIGYTFARSCWGNGYATEAAAAFVDWLVDDVGVARVSGTTHPDNTASVVVLERVGMRFEGHTRNSYWVGDENSDDWILGMTADERRSWRSRTRAAPVRVELGEITPATIRTVERLETHRSQQRFVSPISNSLARALVPPIENGAPLKPWMRSVDADGEIVGFVMLSMITDAHPDPYLWRLLVDRCHQRRGIGRVALDLVIAQAREWGADGLKVSWVDDEIGTPAPLYLAAGFVPTGEFDEGETVARLDLT